MSEMIIHSDGAARGNPGPAGAGAVITDVSGKIISEVCRYLGGDLTNNQAEYRAMLLALIEAKKNGATRVRIFADSELVVKQISGEYKVKNGGLKPLHAETKALLREIGSYTVEYIPREKNKRADKLANLAIDGQML